MKTSLISGQPSWKIGSDHVQAAVTELGGHLGPVQFQTGGRTIEPLSVAPWAEEPCAKDTPALLRALRGDFFCAPFGGNDTPYRKEIHPPHGEAANAKWRFHSLDEDASGVSLNLSLRTRIRPGKIAKTIRLRNGHSAVYSRHVLSGMSGPMNLGHHAMLKFPDSPGAGRISTSAIGFGQVFPGNLEDPAKGGYSSLKPGAEFQRLDRVPWVFGGTTDVSRYPARRGFEDLLMIAHKTDAPFAWTAVTFPEEGYVWFSLKDPRVLQSTVFWISNGGRHYAPWNGRHVNVMGLEDVTSYFHCGLAESARKNPVNRRGFATAVTLDPKTPFVVNSIMGVAAVPRGFDRVQTIRAERGGIALASPGGRIVRAKIDTGFLQSAPHETQ